MSASDVEGPSKAIDGFSTVPMKVFNGLVHGDRRSHVILSPGVIGATASHTCECLTIMINTVYAEHGNLPPTLSVQFDGASNNKCIAVLAYLGLYVLEGVFSSIRVRCLLENHAHDVYDAFQAVHAGRVRHSTFFCLDELRSIIRGAHEHGRDENVLNPIVGHDVLALAGIAGGNRAGLCLRLWPDFGACLPHAMHCWVAPKPIRCKVSNLFDVRDIWEWLCPGYTDNKTREFALANAAFTSYVGLQKFREFNLQLESTSTDGCRSIGLWAKALSAFCSHFERLHLGVGGRRHLLRLGGGAFRCGMLRSASAQSR